MTTIAAPTAGNRILTSDLAAFYNLLKGVAGSGETVTLIYNAAASLIFQPSSDPAANTEAVQIKNNAGTVQGSITFDGKFKSADGTAAAPAHRFQSEATGLFLSSAGVLGHAAAGSTMNILMGANYISIGATPATAGHLRIPYGGTMQARNSTNGADISLISLGNVSANILDLYDSNASALRLARRKQADGTGHLAASAYYWAGD